MREFSEKKESTKFNKTGEILEAMPKNSYPVKSGDRMEKEAIVT